MSDTGTEPTTSVASHLGLGLAAIGRPAYITVGRDDDLGAGADRSVDALRGRAHSLLDAAWWLGIRYIDAARSYGLAKQFLGSRLADHPGRRDELTIGSKWGYEYVGDWQTDASTQERKDHSLTLLDRQWPETLEALGSAPDVYLIHSLTPDSPALNDALLLDRLRQLADSGVRIGFSTSGPNQSDVIDAALQLPHSPFSAVQTTWNLLEPSAEAALARANDARWLVVVKEVLANGRLTPRGTEPAALSLAAADGQSLDGLAIGAAVAHPWADVVLTGAVTRAQLRQNVAAQVPGDAVSPADLAALAESPEQYWAARSARRLGLSDGTSVTTNDVNSAGDAAPRHPQPVFETDRLVLRRWQSTDVDFVFDLYSRWEVQRFIGLIPRVMDAPAEAAERLERLLQFDHPVHGHWAVALKGSGELIGTIILKAIPASGELPLEPSGDTEIGWHFHPDAWGHGYATEAAAAVLSHAFASGLDRVVAVTAPANIPSQNVCLRIGMSPCGLTSRYYNATCELFVAAS